MKHDDKNAKSSQNKWVTIKRDNLQRREKVILKS